MLPEIVGDIGQSIPCLSRTSDDLGVIAIREDDTPPAQTGLALADRCIEVLGGRDLEPLHPSRQRASVIGFHDQMYVRALDAQMNDAEVLATRGGERGLSDRL